MAALRQAQGQAVGEPVEPTPASEFRAMREHGVLQTLPSGRVCRLRTVTPDRLLRLGRLPDILTPLVVRMIYEEVTVTDLDAFLAQKEQVDQALEMINSLNVVCEAGLLEPSIGPGENQISVDDLTLAERGWVFKLVFQPAEVLAAFRYRQAPDVDALPNGENDSDQAEQAAERA